MKDLKRLAWPILAALFVAGCDSQMAPPTSPTALEATTQEARASGCLRTSVGFTPLNEPGTSPYAGVPLGLYPNGANEIPGAHLAAGLQQASAVTPLNVNGTPDPKGRYALISIGMSNTTQEFSVFVAMSPSPNNSLELIDGAQGGQTASDWADPNCPCWDELDTRIRNAGLTNAQVVAAWIKLANSGPTGQWPTAVSELRRDTEAMLRVMVAKFPKLRLGYLSSRIYAGYATTPLNPEPFAYQSGFAVRSVIQDQLNGQLPYTGASRVAPWLAWGPYLWADGMRPRRDGLTWSCGDFQPDGTHPNETGRQKVADQLQTFFRSHPTTRTWFMGS